MWRIFLKPFNKRKRVEMILCPLLIDRANGNENYFTCLLVYLVPVILNCVEILKRRLNDGFIAVYCVFHFSFSFIASARRRRDEAYGSGAGWHRMVQVVAIADTRHCVFDQQIDGQVSNPINSF